MDELNVIIVDNNLEVSRSVERLIRSFYTWGDVLVFNDADEAIRYCENCGYGIAIFVVDVFLEGQSGFFFLDTIEKQFRSAHRDAIIVTGNANEDIVNMCMAANISCLLEKPLRPYALQFAVRAIAEKYIHFAQQLIKDDKLFSAIESLRN